MDTGIEMARNMGIHLGILSQSALVVFISAFTLAITALSRNLRNKLVLTYALLCSVIAVWAFSFFLEKYFGNGTFYKVHLALNLLLAPTGIFFVRALTRVESRFIKFLYAASIVYTVVVWGLSWTSLGQTPFLKGLAFFGPSFLVVVCFYFMFLDLFWPSWGASPVSTARKTWIYIGALVVLLMAAMDHVPAMGEIMPSIGNILLCIYLFVISEAIIHQRLLNLGALMNQILVLIAISMVLTGVYSLLVAWIEHSPALFVLNTFLASFLILLLIDPLKKIFQHGLFKLFSRRYQFLQISIEDAQKQLAGVLDSMGLATLVNHFVEKTLRCESVSFFILRADGTKFRRIRGLRDDGLIAREIFSTHPMVEFLKTMRKRGDLSVLIDRYLENERDRTVGQSQKQNFDLVLGGMKSLGANIVIPLMPANTEGEVVLGLVAIKVERPPEPWGNNWGILSNIYPFFVQAAQTLKNMDVYVKLREKDRLATIGEMAAGLAHEVRNPLGAIKGAAQFLDPQKAGPQSQFLEVIIEEVNRLNRVVTQFLDYSKPISSSRQSFDVATILMRTVAMFRSLPLPENIKIELDSDVRLDSLPNVNCDPEQIKQVLINLIQNSIHALTANPPPSGGVIQIGVFTERRMNDGVLEIILFVEDNGKGIDRDNLDKIFIPFYTTFEKGTGLGLPICAKIVESHGGRIDVLSDEYKMTRFNIHLPV